MFKASLFTLGLAISSTALGQVAAPENLKFDPIQHAATIKSYYEKQQPVPGKLFISIVEHELGRYRDQLSDDDYRILQAESKNLRQKRAEALQDVFNLVVDEVNQQKNGNSYVVRPNAEVDSSRSLMLLEKVRKFDRQYHKTHAKRILAKLSDPAQQLFHSVLIPELAKSTNNIKLQWDKLAKEQPEIFNQMQAELFERVRQMKAPDKAKVVYYDNPVVFKGDGKTQDQVGMKQSGYKVVESKGDEQ